MRKSKEKEERKKWLENWESKNARLKFLENY